MSWLNDKNYKTHNTLLRRNQNASFFDRKKLNEDIPQIDKRFTKGNGELRDLTKYT